MPGFQVEHAAIHQKSTSLATNYGRNLAQLALHFGIVPHQVTIDEINTYLYRISVHEGKSEGYFKHLLLWRECTTDRFSYTPTSCLVTKTRYLKK